MRRVEVRTSGGDGVHSLSSSPGSDTARRLREQARGNTAAAAADSCFNKIGGQRG